MSIVFMNSEFNFEPNLKTPVLAFSDTFPIKSVICLNDECLGLPVGLFVGFVVEFLVGFPVGITVQCSTSSVSKQNEAFVPTASIV